MEYQTIMKDPDNVVEFENLCTRFETERGTVRAVDGVSFAIPKGKTVCVVGESGCGKSVTSLSLMGLCKTSEGEIRFRLEDGTAIDVTKAPETELQKLRGDRIAMIFQEPMTALNPVFPIGKQVGEVLERHYPEMSREAVKARVLGMLGKVGIANKEGVYKMYPHQLSGGMRQRVCIAMALACSPALIIADEPTTALDVTIQAQILELLHDLKEQTECSILFITHDLGVVAHMADLVVVMYAGKVVEKGTVEEIFRQPAHPYTIGLMASKPVVGRKVEKLHHIPGSVPDPVNLPEHCYFRERCDHDCCDGYPTEVQLSHTHFVSCFRYQEETHGT